MHGENAFCTPRFSSTVQACHMGWAKSSIECSRTQPITVSKLSLSKRVPAYFFNRRGRGLCNRAPNTRRGAFFKDPPGCQPNFPPPVSSRQIRALLTPVG
jgi:hypothetical protein